LMFELVVDQAKRVVRRCGVSPLRGAKLFEIVLPYDAQPARFLRQVLGMFLAVQESPRLMIKHPALSKLIGPESSDPKQRRSAGADIAPLRVYASVCDTNWSYLSQPMVGMETDLIARTSAPVVEMLLLCLAPFVFILTTSRDSGLGLDISEYASWSVDQRPRKNERRLVLPPVDRLQAGLRAMLYPGDYVRRRI
jgi:hypothetical protein